MFQRNIDPDERRVVLELLLSLSQASDEIDSALDNMKAQISGLGKETKLDGALTSISEAKRTVERVRGNTTKAEFWPRLRNKIGDKRLIELRVLREAVFEHQLRRLGLYGAMIIASSDGRTGDVLTQQSVNATKEYESMLTRMGGAMGDLGIQYNISMREFI